jgi:hypothetical protein
VRVRWPWLIVAASVVLMAWPAMQAYAAYSTMREIDASVDVQTDSPWVLFSALTSQAVEVPSTVPATSRQAYRQAMEQFVIAGTCVCLVLVVLVAGMLAVSYQSPRPESSARRRAAA